MYKALSVCLPSTGSNIEPEVQLVAEAMEADETDSVKELIEDYLERNQDAFEEFENPEDVYESIEHHMDNVEVRCGCSLCKLGPADVTRSALALASLLQP